MTIWTKRTFATNEVDLKTGSVTAPYIEEGGKVMKIGQDRSTGAQIGITYEHHEIHEGDSWHCAVSTASIGAETGDHVHLLFTTAAVKARAHVIFRAEAAGAVVVTLTEAPTGGGTGGSSKPIYNRKRDKTGTPEVIAAVTTGATVTTGGTVLMTRHIGAGKTSGGGVRGQDEWILKPGTLYSFRAYDTATGVSVFIEMDWYEHASKA